MNISKALTDVGNLIFSKKDSLQAMSEYSSIVSLAKDKKISSKQTQVDKAAAIQAETNSLTQKLAPAVAKVKEAAKSFELKPELRSNDNKVVAGVAGSDAIKGTKATVEVDQVAKAGSVSFKDTFASDHEFISKSSNAQGTLNVKVGDATIDVDVSEITTVGQFVNDFNKRAKVNGKQIATAELKKVGNEEASAYELKITATQTGKDQGAVSVSSSSQDLLSANGFGDTEVQVAQDASFRINGKARTSSSNKVSDELAGVTFELRDAGKATVEVGTKQASAAQMKKLVDSVTALAATVESENSAPTDQSSKARSQFKAGALAQTSVDERALSVVKGALRDAASRSGVTLEKLGVHETRSGELKFDEKQFEKFAADNPMILEGFSKHVADSMGDEKGVVSREMIGDTGSIAKEVLRNDSELQGLAFLQNLASSQERDVSQYDRYGNTQEPVQLIIDQMRNMKGAI